MDSLNLFGVPSGTDAGEAESEKEKSNKRKFVKELIDLMLAIDPENKVQDFEKPKTFIDFDPYSDTPDGLGA